MDDFEQYEVDSDERDSANRFRQLFSDYDRGYDDKSAESSEGTSGGPVDNSTIISGSPTRESEACGRSTLQALARIQH